jgi:hypothetical protein
MKSPSAYEQLRNAQILVLQSKRLLQLYKNSAKQEVEFCEDNMRWMAIESVRQKVSQFLKHGGLVLDEMSIQDDLVIKRQGDSWKLVGMIDMGEPNNISVICNKEKKVQLATHVQQCFS